MRVQILQHVPFEGPGTIAPFFRSDAHQTLITHLYKGERPLPVDEFDFMVVMGGPMGVHDEDQCPWLKQEKRAIETTLGSGKKVLGICLGAQLLAHVLGSTVKPMGYREIGWYEVERSSGIEKNWLAEIFPANFLPLHWHGDTFELPAGCLQIGSSKACKNQGFVMGDQAVGLQFHLEFNASSIRRLCRNAADELVGAGAIQTEAEMLAEEQRFSAAHRLMSDLLARFIARESK